MKDGSKTNHLKARIIAYYLPQFHPIPENDEWWGKGFTEWTNVAKAKPLFRGHYQPHIPADLGFYDLRVPETRIAQAQMARQHGIEGFCYWHYWFAGKRLLERPFDEILKSGQPNFPFCLGWANESWTGIWYGAPQKILMEQTYPGVKDYEAHFYAVLPAFCDDRYIQIDRKPVFVVFRPQKMPEPARFTDYWRELAVKNGLNGLYFVGIPSSPPWHPGKGGFDACAPTNLQPAFIEAARYASRPWHTFYQKIRYRYWRQWRGQLPTIYPYADAVQQAISSLAQDFVEYPTVIPNWDNTPRSGLNGVVLHNATPELFRTHLRQAIGQVAARPLDQRVIFVKSWNEWAEGNHLEPDQKFGLAYLQVIREEINDGMRSVLD